MSAEHIKTPEKRKKHEEQGEALLDVGYSAQMRAISERQKGDQACVLCLQTPRYLRSAQVAPVYLPGDALLCTAATARLASGPVSRQMGKELWPPQRFFDRYLYAKNARRLCSQKILALAQ